MAHDTDAVMELPVRRLERVPSKVRGASLGLIALGVIGFIVSLVMNPTRAWRAYLFNWLYWTSLAQGAVMIATAVVITRGVWARSVRRIAVSFAAFLPMSFVLVLPILFAGEHVFPWMGHDLGGKEVWLNLPFLTARTLIGLAALFGLTLFFVYAGLRPDAGRLREKVPDRLRGWYDRLSRGWRGQEAEEARATRRIRRLAPALGLVYATVFTLISFDLIMSLEPEWLSTLFGGYFFMGALLGGMAVIVIAMLLYRRRFGLEDVITVPTLHDAGKLTFALCIFWAYLFWAQFLVIWYGLLPEEQSFVIHRFESPFSVYALAVFILIFVIPFFGLLGVKPKKTPMTLGLFASIALLGLWFERYILVYPSYYYGAESAPMGIPEVGAALAFAGIFIGVVTWFATRFPILQVWEPMSEAQILGSSAEAPAGVVTSD